MNAPEKKFNRHVNSQAIQLAMTLFRAPNGRDFRKQISAEGNPPARKNFFQGVAERHNLTLRKLHNLLSSDPHADWALITAGVATDEALQMGSHGARRSAQTFPFPSGPGLLVIDVDNCHEYGLANEAAVLAALTELGLTCDAITSPSASSYVVRADGRSSGLRGLHIFCVIDDGREIPRVLEALHVRACLAGWGRIMIAENGVMHVRSIVDQAMRVSCQPVFEWGATLHGREITQSRSVEYWEADEGCSPVLQAASIAPLADAKNARFKTWEKFEKAKLKHEAYRIRSKWLNKQVAKLPQAERPATIERLNDSLESKHVALPPWFELGLGDGKTITVEETVRRAKANPDAWHYLTLRDPFEPNYREGVLCATVFCKGQEDGEVKIISHAHGIPKVYHLELWCGPEDFDDLTDEYQ